MVVEVTRSLGSDHPRHIQTPTVTDSRHTLCLHVSLTFVRNESFTSIVCTYSVCSFVFSCVRFSTGRGRPSQTEFSPEGWNRREILVYRPPFPNPSTTVLGLRVVDSVLKIPTPGPSPSDSF